LAAFETEDRYVTAASERVHQAYALIREQLQAGFDKAKKRYDERVKSTKFSVGDFVWLNRKWLLANKGPYHTVRRINDLNFVVK